MWESFGQHAARRRPGRTVSRGRRLAVLVAATLSAALLFLAPACSVFPGPAGDPSQRPHPGGAPTGGPASPSSTAGSGPAVTPKHKRIPLSIFGEHPRGLMWQASDENGGIDSKTTQRVPRTGRYVVDIACRTGSAIVRLNDQITVVPCTGRPMAAVHACITNHRSLVRIRPVASSIGSTASQFRRTGPC